MLILLLISFAYNFLLSSLYCKCLFLSLPVTVSFSFLASDNYTLQVNPDSGVCNERHLDYFRFIGRIFAMAIYHKRLIDGECLWVVCVGQWEEEIDKEGERKET